MITFFHVLHLGAHSPWLRVAALPPLAHPR